MTPIPVLPASVPPPTAQRVKADDPLWQAAKQLEATFLAEMLKSAGLDQVSDGFGGGIGEEQFTSFLRQTQAEEMVEAGGIGLAESLFHAMKARMDA